MKILHTSDWHVGKVLKGRSRTDEHIRVLAELVGIARDERPDLVLVAGDLFENAAPTPEAKRIVTRALTALRNTGADVIAIAGNHDNAEEFDALRSWADAAGVTLRGRVNQADDLVITGTTAAGERWRVAALPFLSQRYAVRATEMFELTGAEANQTYADHLGRVLTALTAGFSPDAVNLVTAHLTVFGAKSGGGERDAHTIAAYAVPATLFPVSTHYVALGHLHRTQSIPGPCPIHYSGSPLAVDFGEEENSPSVLVVEATADTPAKVRRAALTSPRTLRTLRGSLAELAAAEVGDEWLRVYVTEPPRAGLREEVAELLPNALEIRIDPEVLAAAGSTVEKPSRSGRTPRELFADYLDERGHEDTAVTALFDQLLEEVG